jgi:hypothetical protein
MQPAFALLKTVILEMLRMCANSAAVSARPMRSTVSGRDKGKDCPSIDVERELLLGTDDAEITEINHVPFAGASPECWSCLTPARAVRWESSHDSR